MAKAKEEKIIKDEPTQDTPVTKDEASADKEVVKKVAKEEKVTKAGKHSAKAIKEAEELEAKEARKADNKAKAEDAPKAKPAPKTRSLLERKGKKFQEAAKNIDVNKEYTLKEGVAITSKSSPVKFDATVELHLRLNVDPRQADQNIRGNITLPAGTGKTVRVAVFADGDDVDKAKKAGADIVGMEEITKDLDKGVIKFDTLISTPMMMAKLGKYARVLGPRGLMPNPKSGTVTTNVAKAVTESKAGKVEYRVDSTGIIHLGVGKISFDDNKLLDNINAVVNSIKSNKPSSVKGVFIKSVFITSSMGPSVRIALSEVS